MSIFAEKNVGVASPPLFLSVNMLGGQRLKLAPIFDRFTIVDFRKRHKEELLKERKPVEITRRAGPPRERGGKSDKKADMAFK